MISFDAFVDELVKIAQSDYRKVRVDGKPVYLKKGVPVVSRLPRNPDKAAEKIRRVIRSERAKHSVLGYKTVAFREKEVPNPKKMGFTPTRLATPLPGERLGSVSWRRGTVHMHKQGPLYLAHEDVDDPRHPKWGYWHGKAIRHSLREGVPSMVKRYWKQQRPVVKEEKP